MASTTSSLSLISTAPSSAPSGSTDDTSNSDDTVAIAAAARHRKSGNTLHAGVWKTPSTMSPPTIDRVPQTGEPAENVLMGVPPTIERVNSKNLLESAQTAEVSMEALISSRQRQRTEILAQLRQTLEAHNEKYTSFDNLLQDSKICELLFSLFDVDDSGHLSQREWLESIRENIKMTDATSHLGIEFLHSFMDLLSSVTYLICSDGPVELQSFQKIMGTLNVPKQFFKLADRENQGQLNVDDVMVFVMMISAPLDYSNFSPERLAQMKQIFIENLPPGKGELTLAEFKKILPDKNEFFVQRTFTIFDKDKSGTISAAEFLETMSDFSKQGNTEKITYLFKIYDIDDDGLLSLDELEDVMRACLKESGMALPESDVKELAFALVQYAHDHDPADLDDSFDESDQAYEALNIDQFKMVLTCHEDLLENLTISLASWILPPANRESASKKKKKSSGFAVKNYFRDKFYGWKSYIQREPQMFGFLSIYLTVALVLFIVRMTQFIGMRNLDGETQNVFYMLSRASGRVLLLTSLMVLVLMLRSLQTQLRNWGLSAILPLDHHVYLHKITGVAIFGLAWLHAIMHLINFGVNVQPDPVTFVQMNTDYWKIEPYSDHWDFALPKWEQLGYQHPPGCKLKEFNNVTRKHCINNSKYLSQNPEDITDCQDCESEGGRPWSYAEWIFTDNPKVFGLIPGYAAPTGVGLILILTVMVILSMSFVRNKGHFELFFISHLIGFSLYMVLIFLHAPDVWKWLCAPLALYIIDVVWTIINMTVMKRNTSVINQGVVLPSKVTQLVIKKPYSFRHSPGDWVRIRIPEIAKFEWHPFTISSAPEEAEHFTLHIRGAGNWTKKLYDYYEAFSTAEVVYRRKSTVRKLRSQSEIRRSASSRPRIQKTISVGNKESPNHTSITIIELEPVLKKPKRKQLKIYIEGPFGAPSSDIFRAEHAVLISTGIGVTPFSSILQCIMFRYNHLKQSCPRCDFTWNDELRGSGGLGKLRKVDFFWINRDQRSFEWFLGLLQQLENEQEMEEAAREFEKFLDFHLYFTQALKKTDMKAVGLQLALDLLHKKENKDKMTGLKAKTNAGRPNWNLVFQQLRQNNKGKITVFYCGNRGLANILKKKCREFGFEFKKEIFS